MPIELRQIQPYYGSQNQAFEELVCQCVRRRDASGNNSWSRLHGAGGDGGVEAFWYKSSGYKIGIQAKYFTRSADVRWPQIRSSFETALQIHSDLREYRIYIACNLTGPTGRQGGSGLEVWQNQRNDLQEIAHSFGRDIEINLYGETELLSELAHPDCSGLTEYWFATLEFNEPKIRNWLDSAIDALGDRYHPEDHVEVAAQDVVRALSRCHSTREKLTGAVSTVLECDRLSLPSAWEGDLDKSTRIDLANQQVDALSAIHTECVSDPSTSWPVEKWREQTRSLLEILSKLHFSASPTTPSDDNLRWLRGEISSLRETVAAVDKLVNSLAFRADDQRCAIVVGSAGSGKSHLLAAAAAEILSEGDPCILLLGHRIQRGAIWTQIADQLDMPNIGKDKLLGAFDAYSETCGRRGLIFVDALNESPDHSRWYQDLLPFLNDVIAYPNLGILVSCRDVFVPSVLNDQIRDSFPLIQIHGFVSESEREAAATMYLDRRGIARPSVPWLAPEFVNPLFLRSCCQSLKRNNRTEFPRGLHGTKEILGFYVDSVGRNLGASQDGSTSLVPCCKRALKALARQMASDRRDWVERSEASAIVDCAFSGFVAPDQLTWLEVLERSGILRDDPHPESDPGDDPLSPRPNVLRFSFQRFQEHLMAESLLAEIDKIDGAFSSGSALEFVVDAEGRPLWNWSGLTDALSIQIPEQYGVEYVDVLPGGFASRWEDYRVQTAFVQSIKWRSPEAISDRTLRLANSLEDGISSILELLLELAPRTDHPWNAEFLDKNLRSWKLAVRDQNWTIYISYEAENSAHPVQRLLDWCEKSSKENTDSDVLRLCAITLCWLLSSSARSIRDRATKSLASLLLEREDLFPNLMRLFKDIDDLYILERLVAAGFGVLVRTYDPNRAKAYANVVFEGVFDRTNVPPNLFLRDYAFGVIEIASEISDVNSEIETSRARPPYNSSRPVLNVTREQVENVASQAGGKQILHSCDGFGDFYRYEVERSIEAFVRVPLTNPAPYTRRQLAHRFERNLSTAVSDKSEAFKRLCDVGQSLRSMKVGQDGLSFEIDFSSPFDNEGWRRAEENLLTFLSKDEKKLYRQYWLPVFLPYGFSSGPTRKPESFNSEKASLWIARRAYAMGWTKARFGEDIRDGQVSRDRPDIERIGKKYQWLARSELLARLADRYWMLDEFENGPKVYRYATDLSYERDIDPTLFDSPRWKSTKSTIKELPMPALKPMFELLDAETRLEWPFSEDLAASLDEHIHVQAANGRRMLLLKWYGESDRRTKYYKRNPGHNFAQREFRIITTIVCRNGDGQRLMQFLCNDRSTDIMRWNPIDFTDGPFLYELNRRATWPSLKWQEFNEVDGPAIQYACPVEKYVWESHLDRSLPDGARTNVLANWLMQDQALRLDPSDPEITVDDSGRIVAIAQNSDPDDSGIVVDEEWYLKFLESNQFDCLWLKIGEREAWNDGEQHSATAYRRFCGIVLLSNGRMVSESWNEDHPASEESLRFARSSSGTQQ